MSASLDQGTCFSIILLTYYTSVRHNITHTLSPASPSLPPYPPPPLSLSSVLPPSLSPSFLPSPLFLSCALTSPSSLDVLMFGYLEVILQTPLPSNNSLYNKLTSCANLTKFCKRIRAEHYPDKKTSKSKLLIELRISQ